MPTSTEDLMIVRNLIADLVEVRELRESAPTYPSETSVYVPIQIAYLKFREELVSSALASCGFEV